MYASLRSVTDKNSKILTPTRTGNFLLTSMNWEFYATGITPFLCISLPSLHDNNVNLANFTFSGNVKTKQRDFVTFLLCREIYQNSRRLKRIFEVFENLLA